MLACVVLNATLLLLVPVPAQLGLPPRPPDAMEGSALVERVAELDLEQRERAVVAEVLRGNVPDSWRRFADVRVTRTVGGRERELVYRVAADYLTVGSDADGMRSPLSPTAAQELADALDCVLPTPAMVDEVHASARVQLVPEPIPPSASMTTVAVFARHDRLVDRQLAGQPLGTLVAGHKKDVVLTPRLVDASDRVAIYGWHRPDGEPIQPLYLGHAATWVDYSHGVRLVQSEMLLDGAPTTAQALLADPELSVLLSRAGPLAHPRYGPEPAPAEKLSPIELGPGVRAVAQIPATLDPEQPVHLVLYALPNGSTIEQTVGRHALPDEDWRFTIQHVGAQTRWLRARALEDALVVVYLECDGLAWPRWLRAHDPAGERAVAILDALRTRFGAHAPPRIVLTGHSGGGAFTFAYLDAVERVPGDVERIAFLDSNYGYDAARGHGRKLVDWLKGAAEHTLVVYAYDDSVALLNGETFVSEESGTWGRSHALLADLKRSFAFESSTTEGLQRHTALDGRATVLLKENPERAILHTVQVEQNGFVHALLVGSQRAEIGYRYLGTSVYAAWIAGTEPRAH
ncbi:MAG: hypothetical protein GY711_24940 [bacterium]|nr:hypothetical protein [bacterium]